MSPGFAIPRENGLGQDRDLWRVEPSDLVAGEIDDPAERLALAHRLSRRDARIQRLRSTFLICANALSPTTRTTRAALS